MVTEKSIEMITYSGFGGQLLRFRCFEEFSADLSFVPLFLDEVGVTTMGELEDESGQLEVLEGLSSPYDTR